MQKVWFLYIQDTVFGPYTTDQVRQRLAQGVPEESYVWWKGHSEWIPSGRFEEELPKYLDSQNETQVEEMWSFQKGTEIFGPFQLVEIVDILRNQVEDLDLVKIKSTKMNKWKKAFETPEVTDLLGISRRVNERAPLMGSVRVFVANDKYLVGRSTTISVGGLGVKNIKFPHGGVAIKNLEEELEVGQVVNLEIKSPDLEDIIRAKATVRYKARDGLYGLVFDNPSAEATAIIVSYIKRFKVQHQDAA